MMIACSILACAAIGDQHPLQDSVMVDTVFWSDGRLREIRTYDVGAFDYTFTSWHWNGQLHHMGWRKDFGFCVDSSWDWHGIPQVVAGNGPYSEYFEDGTVSSIGSYLVGWKDSTWTTFHRNGRPSSRGNFKGDFDRANKEGEWTYWYSNGRVHSMGTYKRGGETGPWNFYHPNGRLIHTIEGEDFMNRGRYEQAFDSSGVQTLHGGMGFLTEYHQDGYLSSSIQVRDFHKDTVVSFYPSGASKDRRVYMTDTTRNVWWNESTELDAWDSTGHQTLVRGDGYRWTASDDGETRTRIRYAAGLKHGNSEQYDHRGRLREIDCFDHGNWTGRVIYFNNGRRYTDFDCFNHPWLWKNEDIKWWYNGRLRRYNNDDSLVEYYPNGQLRCIGFHFSGDSAVEADPNREYVLKGYVVGGAESWGEVSSSHYSVADWVRTYYSDGRLSMKVEWVDSCACLLRTEYHPTGAKHWSGCVHYGKLEFKPREQDGDHYFIGYHRTGNWKEFNDQGDLLQVIDFDDLPWEERRIQNYSRPWE